MQALVHKLDAELLPELQRRCALLQHDPRFSGVTVNSGACQYPCHSHIWGMDCHSVTDRDGWARLVLEVKIFFTPKGVILHACIVWYPPQDPTDLQYYVDEYSSRQIIGEPDISIAAFVSELPSLFKAFEGAIARGKPKTLPNKSLEATPIASSVPHSRLTSLAACLSFFR